MSWKTSKLRKLPKEIEQVGTISANQTGSPIAQAMEKGKEGVITAEDGTGLDDELAAVEGCTDRLLITLFHQQTVVATVELDKSHIL